jgi:hypothetical protein
MGSALIIEMGESAHSLLHWQGLTDVESLANAATD